MQYCMQACWPRAVKQLANFSARLAGKAAGQGCRARQLGKAAGQGCRARLPGIMLKAWCIQHYAKSMVKLDNNAVF
jgi:hypothetical protein